MLCPPLPARPRSELSSEEAHTLFAEEFVPAWNAGKLGGKYYSGTAARATQRTDFKWNIKGGPVGPCFGPTSFWGLGAASAARSRRTQRL